VERSYLEDRRANTDAIVYGRGSDVAVGFVFDRLEMRDWPFCTLPWNYRRWNGNDLVRGLFSCTLQVLMLWRRVEFLLLRLFLAHVDNIAGSQGVITSCNLEYSDCSGLSDYELSSELFPKHQDFKRRKTRLMRYRPPQLPTEATENTTSQKYVSTPYLRTALCIRCR